LTTDLQLVKDVMRGEENKHCYHLAVCFGLAFFFKYATCQKYNFCGCFYFVHNFIGRLVKQGLFHTGRLCPVKVLPFTA